MSTTTPAPELLDRAGRICHEVRKPLAAIVAFAEMLQEELSGSLNGEQARHLAAVISNADRLDRLISRLFELAEVKSGRLHLARETANLEELCHEVRHHAEGEYCEKGVELELVTSGPVLHPDVDVARMRRTLSQLLINALSACQPGGKVTLSLDSCDGVVSLMVTDSGIGIEVSPATRVFEPFLRAESGAPSGLGIGLYIGRAVVEAHGGRLKAENCLGGGASFRMELPLQED